MWGGAPRVGQKGPAGSNSCETGRNHEDSAERRLPCFNAAGSALAEIRKFNHASREADQIPADTSRQISDLTALVGALPQALSQLAGTLTRALANQTLTKDPMVEEADAAPVVDVARLHLDEAGCFLADARQHLDAAHNATAHLVSNGIHQDQQR